MSGPAPSAPCGTVSAYKRHLRRGEQPCGKCRGAWAEYHRQRYAQRKSDEAAYDNYVSEISGEGRVK